MTQAQSKRRQLPIVVSETNSQFGMETPDRVGQGVDTVTEHVDGIRHVRGPEREVARAPPGEKGTVGTADGVDRRGGGPGTRAHTGGQLVFGPPELDTQVVRGFAGRTHELNGTGCQSAAGLRPSAQF